jgi:hypothetical protein
MASAAQRDRASGDASGGPANLVGPFREGLHELGYQESRNIVIEYRWAEGKYERFPALVAELLAVPVDVIVTAGTPATLAVKKSTSTVPLVMIAVGDPVGTGIVASLARPEARIPYGLVGPDVDIRLALGFAVCLWIVIHLFMLPGSPEGYSELGLPRPCDCAACMGSRHRHLVTVKLAHVRFERQSGLGLSDGVRSAYDPKRTSSLARASLKQRLGAGGVHGQRTE